jgi:hypothetical protein
MGANRLWCRAAVLGPGGAELFSGAMEGRGWPDLAAVDDLAWLALLAGRIGGRLVLSDVSPAMAELLELTGLAVEVGGEPELREEALGVEEGEEETHLGDLAP